MEELYNYAKSIGLRDLGSLPKAQVVFEIVKAISSKGEENLYGEGVLEVLPDGFGFLRSPNYNYLPSLEDIYVSPAQIRRFNLRKAKHIQFRKQLYSIHKNEVETYQIDVIVESYLNRYLDMIESEVEKIKRVLQRKKSLVIDSLKKIIEEAREAEEKPESYRKYFEF